MGISVLRPEQSWTAQGLMVTLAIAHSVRFEGIQKVPASQIISASLFIYGRHLEFHYYRRKSPKDAQHTGNQKRQTEITRCDFFFFPPKIGPNENIC